MQTEYEKVLTIRDDTNKLKGFWCHDMKSHTVELYLCEKASLDEIKELVEKLKINNDLSTKVNFRVLPHDETKDLKANDLYEISLTPKVGSKKEIKLK